MKLTENCYAVTGLYYETPWNVNAGFIVGGKKTLVIDSGSNAISAQTVYGYANIAGPGNELVLINTERQATASCPIISPILKREILPIGGHG